MRLRLALPCVAALLLAACADSAAIGVTPEEARFVEAVERTGCVVANDAQASAIEARTGFGPDKLRAISTALLARGVLTLEGENIKLTTGTCANA